MEQKEKMESWMLWSDFEIIKLWQGMNAISYPEYQSYPYSLSSWKYWAQERITLAFIVFS